MTYEELYKYFTTNKTLLTSEMLTLENIFASAREPKEAMYNLFQEPLSLDEIEKPLPVYLTRSRIKSLESAFLKTKRKGKSEVKDISDMIGIRVLCLFNQDIDEIYKFILKMFKSAKYSIDEINIFGWENTAIFNQIFDSFKFEEVHGAKNIYNPITRSSGYKSIHITGIINPLGYRFEIQLRTLLQDVWGEMSHKIAYKQKGSYSYINNSFKLLARDLETNDQLLAQLKIFTNEKKCLEDDSEFKLSTVFRYENPKLPSTFLLKGALHQEYKEYSLLVYENQMANDEKKLNLAEKKYEELVDKYLDKSDRNDPNYIYWYNMEKAFYNLGSNDKKRLKLAEQYYRGIDESYVASFRLGQIAIHKGNFVLAMRYFDHCKTKFSIGVDLVKSNIFKVHINMSVVFWNYGTEYLSSAIEEIEYAIKLIQENTYDYSNESKGAVFNCACWYYIEYCYELGYKNNNYLDKAEEYYKELVKIAKVSEKYTKTTYDTLAWYNYLRFCMSKKENITFIQQAKFFIDEIPSIMSIDTRSSRVMYDDHTQIINCEYEKYASFITGDII